MATTPKGIFFPEGGTNMNFLAIFQALANSIDTALGDFTYDSGWIDVPESRMYTGWSPTNTTGTRVRYRKIGKNVKVEGGVKPAATSTGVNIFNLPIGFRPVGVWGRFTATVQSYSTSWGMKSVLVNAKTDGDIGVASITSAGISAGSSIYLGNISFFTD